jgi:GNAT superfamily N-acetyltransferase
MPVRTAVRHDADAIMDIYNTSLEELQSSFPYRPFTRESAADFIRERGENGGLVLVWEEEGRIGGFAEYAPFQDWKTEEAIADYGLYIRKDCRRKGLGENCSAPSPLRRGKTGTTLSWRPSTRPTCPPSSCMKNCISPASAPSTGKESPGRCWKRCFTKRT